MGNWMTVLIEGTMDSAEVEPLCDYLTAPAYDGTEPSDSERWQRFGPLTISSGLCGLGDWPAVTMMVVGNCAERGYNAESVADHLRRCLDVAPSLDVKVHCGGDYESLNVVASVLCRGGQVGVVEPSRATLPEISDEVVMARMMKALS